MLRYHRKKMKKTIIGIIFIKLRACKKSNKRAVKALEVRGIKTSIIDFPLNLSSDFKDENNISLPIPKSE